MAASIGQAVLRSLVPHRREDWRRAAAAGFARGLVRAGLTFVKIGQLIASVPGVFPPVLADACLRCLDDVPPFDADTAEQVITADLGSPPSVLFSSFERVPLAAGSIAQVHGCVLLDGRPAVLKLQRPGIREEMTVDLRIMHRLASLLEHTRLGRSANVVGVVEDLSVRTFEELDFQLEAQRQQQFRSTIGSFGDNHMVTALAVLSELSGPRVLCMERLAGIPLDDLPELTRRGVDGPLVLRRIAKTWLEAAVIHGPFHGDVHAGNLWVLDDGRAAFLDFGITGELDEGWKGLYRDLFRASAIDGDFSRVAAGFKKVGAFPAGTADNDEIGLALLAAFGPVIQTGVGSVSVGELLRAVVELLDRYTDGAGTPRELVLVMKQILYFERYAKALAPEWTLATDLYLLRNIFPDLVADKALQTGEPLPD